MMRFAAIVVILGWACAAQAQPAPIEGVTVTAPRLAPETVVHDYIDAYAAPAPAIGKIARWHARICPVTVGLPAAKNAYVTARVKEIAALAGAPVTVSQGCRPNIDIVFTFNPKVLLESIRTQQPALLGYYDPARQKAQIAAAHAVQAWYATATMDDLGAWRLDDKRHNGETVFGEVVVPADVTQVTGTHLKDDLRSEIHHAIVIVDLGRIGDPEIGPLADHIAMLALSQTGAYDTCLAVPSIANLLSPACDAARKPDAIGAYDLAYLRGLYRMDAGGNLARQRNSIADEMKKALQAP